MCSIFANCSEKDKPIGTEDVSVVVAGAGAFTHRGLTAGSAHTSMSC